MLFELTLFANFTLLHFVIGTVVYFLLAAIFKFAVTSAEMRSWLWVCAFVLCTLVPFVAFVNTSTNNPVELANTTQLEHQAASVKPKRPNTGSPVVLTIQSHRIHNASYFIYFLLLIWFLGSCWRTMSVSRTLSNTRKLIQKAQVCERDQTMKCLSDVKILSSEQTSTPMVIGLISPAILVPTAMAEDFSEKQLTPILLHELAHIQRNDLWIKLFQEVLAIIFWWSPVMRQINLQIHLCRELACDFRAAKQLSNNQYYAQSLLNCAKLMVVEKRNVMAMGLFSKKKELNIRINEMLKPNYSARPKTATVLAACFTLATTSIVFANAAIPKINVASVKQSANHYSTLSEAKTNLLLAAIHATDTHMIELMIDNGADINTPLMSDGTALIIAVKNNDQELVSALIDMGANVNQSALGDGNPLIVAAMVNNLSIADYLLDQGANINAIVDGDETPLINASHRGHFDMVKLLLERGADANLGVNAPTIQGNKFRTPLNRAKTTQITRLLEQFGAKV